VLLLSLLEKTGIKKDLLPFRGRRNPTFQVRQEYFPKVLSAALKKNLSLYTYAISSLKLYSHYRSLCFSLSMSVVCRKA
jgi:uncharacterized protein YciW